MDAESYLSQQFQTAFTKRNPVYHLQHPQQCLLQETANAVLRKQTATSRRVFSDLVHEVYHFLGMHDATRTILDGIDLIDIWHFLIEHDSSMIYFDLNTLHLAVDTDVTSQHISCTSICPSLLRGSLPRQLRVKVRDHIVHNSTALHLHSRLERQETCNSWKTRKHAPPQLFQQSVCWKMNGTSKRPCVELCVEIL